MPAISVDRVGPHVLGDRGDRRPFPLGDCPADGEFAAHRGVTQRADVGEELPGATGAIGADQDRGAVTILIGQLRQRGIEDGDVVGCGVAARVALAQLRGQELAGVIAERQQRVIPERALERRRR